MAYWFLCVFGLSRKVEKEKKNIIVYFTLVLLVIYSASAYFVPDYLSREVLRIEETIDDSNKFTSELIESIEDSEETLTKEMVVRLVSASKITNSRNYNDLSTLTDLIKQYSSLLFYLLFLHIIGIISFIRIKKRIEFECQAR